MNVGKSFSEAWAETLAVLLLLVGFLISLLLKNAFLVYVVVLIGGFLAGRIFYIKRFKEPIFPFVLMILGFLLGYLLGAVWASRFWTAVLFFAGFGASYYLHLKSYLQVFEKDGFVK